MIDRILYIPHDHLNTSFGVLKNANPKTDAIVLVESARMTSGRNWHRERLFFLISSARHFATELEEKGFNVRYIQAATTLSGINQAKAELGVSKVVCAEPSSYLQSKQLAEAGVVFVDNDFFLTSRKLFSAWAENQKSFLM